MLPNIQETTNNKFSNQYKKIMLFLLLKVNQDIIFLKMLRIYQILTTIINREMFFQLDINMVHKAKLILKMLLCNLEIVTDIQLCSLNTSMTFQRTPKTYLTPTTITNREMFFQQVTSTTHRAKLTSKITLCNQEIATDIQLCSTNRKQLPKLKPEQKMTKKTAVMKLIASQIMKKLRDQQLRMLLQFKRKEIMMIKLLQWQLDT
jgi:hypothetical protein